MLNDYKSLFKDITPERWKEICDTYLTSDGIREYFGVDIPANILSQYCRKFGYKPPLRAYTKDERGHRYGKLVVTNYAGHNSQGRILWECKCDCGNTVVRESGWLRSANRIGRISCCDECLKKNNSKRRMKDITGQTINLLHVEEQAGRSSRGCILYKCKCLNCGNEILVDSGHLIGENTQVSCGCVRSKGEYYINKCLIELHIPYETQYKFSDCYYKAPLRFDFAVFDESHNLKCLIEYQGKQHYQMAELFADTEEKFQNRQERDQIKRDYCAQHNIPLIEIKYTDLNKINKNYLLELIQSC